jgi:hypothetical protein
MADTPGERLRELVEYCAEWNNPRKYDEGSAAFAGSVGPMIAEVLVLTQTDLEQIADAIVQSEMVVDPTSVPEITAKDNLSFVERKGQALKIARVALRALGFEVPEPA